MIDKKEEIKERISQIRLEMIDNALTKYELFRCRYIKDAVRNPIESLHVTLLEWVDAYLIANNIDSDGLKYELEKENKDTSSVDVMIKGITENWYLFNMSILCISDMLSNIENCAIREVDKK